MEDSSVTTNKNLNINVNKDTQKRKVMYRLIGYILATIAGLVILFIASIIFSAFGFQQPVVYENEWFSNPYEHFNTNYINTGKTDAMFGSSYNHMNHKICPPCNTSIYETVDCGKINPHCKKMYTDPRNRINSGPIRYNSSNINCGTCGVSNTC